MGGSTSRARGGRCSLTDQEAVALGVPLHIVDGSVLQRGVVGGAPSLGTSWLGRAAPGSLATASSSLQRRRLLLLLLPPPTTTPHTFASGTALSDDPSAIRWYSFCSP